MAVVDPDEVCRTVLRVAAQTPFVGVFAESSSPMFRITAALGATEPSPYVRFSPHYGSMGHALGGALGFCAATGMRAVVLTGDGSLDLMDPLRSAVKHGCLLTLVVLNDSRLGLPYFGSIALGISTTQAMAQLPPWTYSAVGSTLIAGVRVDDPAKLAAAVQEALTGPGCHVLDIAVDPAIAPPVGARDKSVLSLFDPRRHHPPLSDAA